MKYLQTSLLCLAGLGGLASAAEPIKPNIVLIIGDDQAWTDYGFMDHSDIRTPHLDRLAQRGLVFTHGYVTAPLCRPSLASLVTGLYPFQHGITGNDVDGNNKRAALDVPLREAFHRHPSIIKLLTRNGYLAHQSGKWWAIVPIPAIGLTELGMATEGRLFPFAAFRAGAPRCTNVLQCDRQVSAIT